LLHFILIKAKSRSDFSQQSCSFLRVLLEHGANPNGRDTDDNTPIYYAVTPDHFRILLEFGANTKVYNRKCLTPLLHHIQLNHNEIAKQLIEYDSYIDEIDNEGNSPLHAAVIQNLPEIVALLLRKGVSYYIPNQEHQTAVDLALEKPAMKAVFETFLQYQLCNALKSNFSKKVTTLIVNNRWMSLEVNGASILEWAKNHYPQSKKSIGAMEKRLNPNNIDSDEQECGNWIKL
jgi:ankyrin repeat protein